MIRSVAWFFTAQFLFVSLVLFVPSAVFAVTLSVTYDAYTNSGRGEREHIRAKRDDVKIKSRGLSNPIRVGYVRWTGFERRCRQGSRSDPNRPVTTKD